MFDTVVIVVVIAVVLVLVFGALNRAKALACPQCGTKLPAVRKPTSVKQMLWGGWTCPACGCAIDRTGKAIPKT